MAFVLDASVALGWVLARQASAYGKAIRQRARRELLRLARRFDLSAYDASYLALAQELKLPVACSDGPLRAALGRAGVKLA